MTGQLESEIKKEVERFSTSDPNSLIKRVITTMTNIKDNVKNKRDPVRFNSAYIAYVMMPIFVDQYESTASSDPQPEYLQNGFQAKVDKLLASICREAETALVPASPGVERAKESEDQVKVKKAKLLVKAKLFQMVVDHVIEESCTNYTDDFMKRIHLALTQTICQFAFESHTYIGDQARVKAFDARMAPVPNVIKKVSDASDKKEMESLHVGLDWFQVLKEALTAVPDAAKVLGAMLWRAVSSV